MNNAGIQFVAKIDEFPAERWDAIIAINLSAVFHGMQGGDPRHEGNGLGPHHQHRLGAWAGRERRRRSAYVAAKHGVVGMTKVAAIELANCGVTVNAICPGWVLTPLVQQQLEARATARRHHVEQAKQRFLAEKQPMAKFSTPEGDWRAGGVPVLRCGADHHRRAAFDRRRLGRAVTRDVSLSRRAAPSVAG